MIDLINNKTWTITISDLGVELKAGESIILDDILDKYIIESEDLKTTDAIFQKDGVEITYDEMIRYMKKLNHFDHIESDTHAHNIRDDSFFDTEKVDGVTSKITYYRDVAKTEKIREEEIIRSGGVVNQIKSTIFDDTGAIVEIETQTLNRDASGKVESITTSIED